MQSSPISRPQSELSRPSDAQKVFQGSIFSVYQWQQPLFNGSTATFEQLSRADTALIIPITTNKKILILEEEQPGRAPFLSLPGGRLEPNEDVAQAAERELLEETGYVAQEMSLLTALQPYTKIDWAIFTLIAKGCEQQGEQNLDGGERIQVHEHTFEEFVEFAKINRLREPTLQIMVLQALLDPQKYEDFRNLLLG